MATEITPYDKQIHNIRMYFYNNIMPPLPNLLEECVKAKENMFNLSMEQKLDLMGLASYWSSLIRNTYKLYVIQLGYAHSAFWDAFIQVFVLNQSILLDYRWGVVIDGDNEFKDIINKTVFPKWIYKMFVGIDSHWLFKEMSKYVERIP